ncbi:MAG: type II secretion system F family protein [archaeon]
MFFFPKSYRILAYKIMKRIGLLNIDWFTESMEPLKPTLKRARLYVTAEEYISTSLLTIMLTTPLAVTLFYFIFTEIIGIGGAILLLIMTIITISYILGTFLAFLIYPSYRLDKMRENMEKHMPYAAGHMATIAGSEIPMYKVFQTIGDFGEYGKVSDECRRIYRNIEAFGYDTITAISEAAKQTPSPNFKDMLWGLVSIEKTGGDVRSYLFGKSKQYMEEQKDKQREYIDSLEIMAEIYTTVFVAGPILAVIMITVMGTMGGLPMSLREIFILLIYILIPIASVIYLVMLKGARPETGI